MDIANKQLRCLSGNMLKIIAAVSMFIDHVGLMFFPRVYIFRVIGRLAFPIFAFMIAEGCRYTKNRLKYLLTVTFMGLAYTAVYYVYSKKIYFCILVTFSLAIMLTFSLQEFKNAVFSKEASFTKKILTLIIFLATLATVITINHFFFVDYGLVGCLTPMFVSMFHSPQKDAPKIFSVLDTLPFHVLGLLIGIITLYIVYGGVRIFAILAIPLLLLYSGKRGKAKMKYFFYIFYPAHLLALEGIAMLINTIN